MNILLAAKHAPEGPKPIGGVQSWCRTVKAELIRLGHDAVTWGPEQRMPAGKFDLGVIANVDDTGPAVNRCRAVLVISHGIIPAEQPPVGLPVAFTSEGVRDHWGGYGPIIRQPIDLEFWSPDDSKREWLTRYSYRSAPIYYAPGYKHRHVKHADPVQARKALRSSVCVYATGRAALEAMACDVPVLIYDHRYYQGPLMGPRELRPNMEQNYSGRGGFMPTPQDVEEETLERIEVMDNPRAWVERRHDSRQVVQELLALVSCT